MNRNETVQILNKLNKKYPGYFRAMKKGEKEAVVTRWMSTFQDVDFDTVKAAADHYIQHSDKNFFPYTDEIEKIIKNMHPYPEQPESPTDLVDLYRQMLIDFQNEWRSTGELPSMKDYEVKYGIRTELRSDGHTELHWR